MTPSFRTLASRLNLDTAIRLSFGSILFFLPISKAVVETGSALVLGLWLIQKIRRPSRPLPTPIFFIFSAFLLWVFFSAVFVEPTLRLNSIKGVGKWLQYIGLFVVAADFYRRPGEAAWAFKIFLVSMLLVTCDGWFQLATGTDFLRGRTLNPGRITRMTGPMGAATLLASFYFFALPLVIALAQGTSKKQKIICGFLAAIFASGFVLTYARAAFFALLCCTVMLLLIRKKTKILLGLGLVLVTLFIALQPFRYNYIETMKPSDITIGLRQEYWSQAFELLKKRPALGHGVNTYYARAKEIQTQEGLYHGYPHNSYLHLAVELGGIGLSVFLIGLGLVLIRSRFLALRDPVTDALALGCTAFLLQCIVDNHFFALETAVLFWVFFGLLHAWTEVQKCVS